MPYTHLLSKQVYKYMIAECSQIVNKHTPAVFQNRYNEHNYFDVIVQPVERKFTRITSKFYKGWQLYANQIEDLYVSIAAFCVAVLKHITSHQLSFAVFLRGKFILGWMISQIRPIFEFSCRSVCKYKCPLLDNIQNI